MQQSVRTALQLVWVTDGQSDPERIVGIASSLAAAGVRAIQLREPGLSARELAVLSTRLRDVLAPVEGLLLINDRADLCAAGYCHGVHLPSHGLDADVVRRLLPDEAVVGVAVHDVVELERAEKLGADYAMLAPVFRTDSKPGKEPIGVERARQWTGGVGLPVVWLGGIDLDTLVRCEGSGAVGFACLSALAAAPERAAEYVGLVQGLLEGRVQT